MNLIPRLAEVARYVELPDMSAHRQQTETNNTLIARLEEVAKSFLPVEEQARRKVSEQLLALEGQNSALMKQMEKAQKAAPIVERYKRLSLDPLRWRDNRGLPRLVVFSMRESTFSMSVELIGAPLKTFKPSYQLKPIFPESIAQCYADVFETLESHRSAGKNLKISCEFNGVIPDGVRQQINEVEKERLFERIFLIAEPGEWQFDLTAPMPADDPLVVGHCEDLSKSLWLITSFDVTPIEQAMLSYTSMPDKAPGGVLN